MRIVRAVFFFVAILSAGYCCGAFITWDARWLIPLSELTDGQRLGLIWFAVTAAIPSVLVAYK